MGNGLLGMIMDRRNMKELSRMEKEMGNVLVGMRMERRKKKELTRIR